MDGSVLNCLWLNKSPGIFHLQAFTEVTEVCEIRVEKKEH